MGWQKRGNGFSYDSLTGVSSLFGELSGLILDVAVLSKSCSDCHHSPGGVCMKPTCKINHHGSSKSMEPAAAVKLMQSIILKEGKVRIAILVGDEDSSTAAAVVRAVFGDTIKKVSDINHATKNIKNRLFNFKSDHKQLTNKTIKYIMSTVTTIIKKNKNEPIPLASDLKNAPEHFFNNHKGCGDWCRALADPIGYKSKYLDDSLGAHGCPLYVCLVDFFGFLATLSEKLAPCGSSQRNECFNSVLASKAPKYDHYGGSSSLWNRVCASVCQINDGVGWTAYLFEELGVSPGIFSQEYKEKLSRLKEKQKELRKTPVYKSRRKLNIIKKTNSIAVVQNIEGDCYLSGMALDNNTAPNIPTSSNTAKNTQFWPLESKKEKCTEMNSTLIYCDTETSGLSTKYHQILQISAMNPDGDFSDTWLRSHRKT
jgi:hypothetical protein